MVFFIVSWVRVYTNDRLLKGRLLSDSNRELPAQHRLISEAASLVCCVGKRAPSFA